MKRKLCVVTGARAEYGLLKPLLDKIKTDKGLTLQLIVTGMHLSPEFGYTYRTIEKDHFRIDDRIDILLNSDTPASICKSMGLAITGFAETYQRLKPDILIVLGDRFEIFSAVSAALVSRIPVAHLYGGELTEGAFDDAFRHSITKMSHLHFTSTAQYRQRVIQLGEHPDRVFNVGAIGLDNIRKLNLLPKKELEKELAIRFNKHNLLVTFHPVTLEHNTSGQQFQNLLYALNRLENTNIIFTKANADTGGQIINKMIDEYVLNNSYKAIAFTSLGQLKYLSTLQFVDAVVGNSSSGIIEAPSFKIGTINIGDRQKGRIRSNSIIDCHPSKQGIRNAIRMLYSQRFQGCLKSVISPYGDGNSTEKIIKIIKRYNLTDILKKSFYDIRFSIQKR
jgi:GDP/UDP-N,N'-diacetylbacillosamine 2-epimerase (hydrolysing)